MTPRVRLDRWLWAARVFKTRAQAVEAITGGKVQVNSVRAKAAKLIQVGDGVRVRKGPFDFLLTVRALSERRGPASVAAALYEESLESRRTREQLAEQLRIAPSPAFAGKGRPTKKQRRDIERLHDELDS